MWIGVLCGLLAGAMWGLVFIVPELLGAFTPLELAVGRYLAYGAMAFVLLLPRLKTLVATLVPADYAALLRHALAGNIVYYMLLAAGVKYAGVAPTSLIIGMLPVVVTLMGRNDIGAAPLARLALPLLLVGAGIACINVDTFLHAGPTASPGEILLGMACAAGALLCWSWYALDNARYLKRNPQFSSAQWSALYGLATGIVALLLGAAAWGWAGSFAGSASTAPARDWQLFWACNALLALGASVIGNGLWNVASRRVPVTLSGQLILFETLFALLYGFLYRGHGPRPLELAAIGLLVAGVTWAVRAHAPPPSSGRQPADADLAEGDRVAGAAHRHQA